MDTHDPATPEVEGETTVDLALSAEGEDMEVEEGQTAASVVSADVAASAVVNEGRSMDVAAVAPADTTPDDSMSAEDAAFYGPQAHASSPAKRKRPAEISQNCLSLRDKLAPDLTMAEIWILKYTKDVVELACGRHLIAPIELEKKNTALHYKAATAREQAHLTASRSNLVTKMRGLDLTEEMIPPTKPWHYFPWLRMKKVSACEMELENAVGLRCEERLSSGLKKGAKLDMNKEVCRATTTSALHTTHTTDLLPSLHRPLPSASAPRPLAAVRVLLQGAHPERERRRAGRTAVRRAPRQCIHVIWTGTARSAESKGREGESEGECPVGGSQCRALLGIG